jgi:hypothetical protein
VKAGPYEDDEGHSYEVRLERVPGGLRLGEWAAGALRKRAPVLRAGDLDAMLEDARSREVLPEPDVDALSEALATEAGGDRKEFGASPGRTGDMQEELRVERRGDGMVRIARWIFRPGTREWELQDAPAMLPAKRYAQALRDAARAGLLSGS